MPNTVNDVCARIGASQRSSRSIALAVAAATILLVGCGSDGSASTTAAPADRTSTSAPPEAPPATSPAALAESPLEGSWRTQPISSTQTEATVRHHGLGRWVKEYRKNAPFTDDTVLTLTIENGAWDLYGESAGEAPEPIDYDAEYEINDDIVVFRHSDGSNTYRWEVVKDTLRLQFVRSTMPGYRGIPEEVFQRALYMTTRFSRQP